MKSYHAIATVWFTVLIGALATATADIPKSSQAALQKQAAEKLEIEVTKVAKSRKLGGEVNLEIEAEITGVESTKTGLKEGDTVVIRYWIQNPKKRRSSTSEPIALENGKGYKAYLGPPADAYKHLVDKKRKIYFPQAASGSFVLTANSNQANGN